MGNIGLYTYLVAAVAFALLAVLIMVQQRRTAVGPALLAGCSATALWAGTVALGTLAEYPPLAAIQLTEAARNLAWLFLLVQLLCLQNGGDPWRGQGRRWRGTFALFTLALLVVAGLRGLAGARSALGLSVSTYHNTMLAISLLVSLAGLLLIEQLYRNGTQAERWSLKYLCFSLGTLWAYDFFMYAEALLFRQLDANLWQARGLVTALVTPWLAVAIARNRDWQLELHVSRQVVFHTVTLMGAGVYLLGMAAIGYFIRFLGGSWGGVLQVGFLAAALGLLASLLFSGKLRAQLRVLLSKHFFSYRYDYREEWLKFTQALAALSDNVAEGIIATMAPLASSPAGLLFAAGDGAPRLLAHWQMPPPGRRHEGLGNLPAWLARTDWVIDLRELREKPDLYQGLALPAWLQADEQLWLIIPLVFRDSLEGILMLRRSDLKERLNWEDRDLLKTAGRQAASHLAQHLAAEALVEARQFDAFNRLSAYVIHDLKNILAQQSLIVSNAEKHRDNPAFIDDMIATVGNSVTRMQRLMEQMRSGVRSAPAGRVDLCPLLEQVAAERAEARPAPTLECAADACPVEADRDRLATVFGHLVQNAQEATPDDGEVRLSLTCSEGWVTVAVSDSGRGMDASFLRDRLFRPFDSTKGLTGMGIGAFESREYVRQLGGDIEVESTPGEGTIFRVRIPALAQEGADEPARTPAAAPIAIDLKTG